MSTSELSPIDPSSVPNPEQEPHAPWIIRKLVGSMTGRIVLSSYESLRAAGTSVVCLSPWGDSSPLLLPCIRFRDLAMHAVIAGTGGTAAIMAPVMGPVGDAFVTSFGDTIVVEVGMHVGFEGVTKAADDLLLEKPLKHFIPSNDKRLITTAIKTLTITLKHKSGAVTDAALGFFRSSVHEDTSLFASVKDYLSVEKGWFSPYLFASARRPVIPRSMQPDVIFCHGPFLSGDYRVGETLLAEAALVISLCEPPSQPETGDDTSSVQTGGTPKEEFQDPYPKYRPISNLIARKRHEHSISDAPPDPSAPIPERRLLVTVLGIKPHRTDSAWSTSNRPSESLLRYLLLNGCPAIIVPVRRGCPLLAWDTLTLDSLFSMTSKAGNEEEKAKKLEGVVNVLAEYLSLCVEWDRVVIPSPTQAAVEGSAKEDLEDNKKQALKEAIGVLIVAASKAGESKPVKKDVDAERAGVVMFRIP